MQANKDYFIMINNEAEYKQAVKMLRDMGFLLDTQYTTGLNLVYTNLNKIKSTKIFSVEKLKENYPDDIELFINDESKQMTTTKHNVNIADHPELYNVIVLTRTQEEWDDVIQYDPDSNNPLTPKHFDKYQENSVVNFNQSSFGYSDLQFTTSDYSGNGGSGGDYIVMYYSQWKALIERIAAELAAEQKENDKFLFANKELKQFKDLSDSEKLIVVNALISDYSKVEYCNIQTKIWNEKDNNDIIMNSVYRVLK